MIRQYTLTTERELVQHPSQPVHQRLEVELADARLKHVVKEVAEGRDDGSDVN